MRRKFISPSLDALRNISLLRRLAIEQLLGSDSITLPECRQKVVIKWTRQTAQVFHEEACWTLPVGAFICREPQATANMPIACIKPVGLPECTIGLWVQIGELTSELNNSLDGELVYRCIAPLADVEMDLDNARFFLNLHGSWYWRRMPDVYGAVTQARQRLQDRVEIYQTQQAEKLRQIRANVLQSAVPRSQPLTRKQASSNIEKLPPWTSLKRKNTPYFAYQMRADGAFWIVMAAAGLQGYYIVPGSGAYDGWAEVLPTSFGHADVGKGAYYGDGSIDIPILLLRELGVVDSFVDSEIDRICKFTGWAD